SLVFSVEALDASKIQRRISSRGDVVTRDGGERKSRCEDANVTEQTLARARAGDEDAFRELTDSYRHELQLHAYRIVGSAQDAEDVLQETLLAAWRGLDHFEERASVRSWLYRIATNRSLDALRASRRRPEAVMQMSEVPEPTRRAGAAFETRLPATGRERAPLPNSKLERDVVGRLADAFEAGDIDGVVALLTDGAWLTMPPEPYEYQGQDAIGNFLNDRAVRRG